MPDGRPIEIVVETAGEDTEQTDILELICENWANIGIKLFSKPSQRDIVRNRIFPGEAIMSVWTGRETGRANANTHHQEHNGRGSRRDRSVQKMENERVV